MTRYELIIALTRALEKAEQRGQRPRAASLAATLSQEVHLATIGIPGSKDVAPALTMNNGRIDPALVDALTG